MACWGCIIRQAEGAVLITLDWCLHSTHDFLLVLQPKMKALMQPAVSGHKLSDVSHAWQHTGRQASQLRSVTDDLVQLPAQT